MKRNVSNSGLTFSRRVTRSTTTFHRNSLPVPDELVFEIFSRLPLKSIAICRCVCKLWSSILRRQDFTELFFTRSCARPQLLFACEDHSHKIVFFSSPQPEDPEDNSYLVATNHIARFPKYYNLFGCTNGFFCYITAQGRKNPVLVTVICNPSTRQSLILPRLNACRDRVRLRSYLGYDPIEKLFKVLSVLPDDEEVHVLTLGTNRLSWRVVECCTPHYPSTTWICISGVLYYLATPRSSSLDSYVACFDLRTEKFSFVEFLPSSNTSLYRSKTLVNYSGGLGLFMPVEDSGYVSRSSKSFELWVLRDAAKHEWSNHVYMLPVFWKDVVAEDMRIAGMVGVNEIVFTPWCRQYVPSYVIYYNVESKRIRKVGIQGMEAFPGMGLTTYLNYVENVKLL